VQCSLIGTLVLMGRSSDGADLSKLRTNLEQRGVSVGIQYIGDVYSILQGGLESGHEYLHLVNTPITLDMDRFVGLSGGSIYVNSQWATGGSPTELAGDLQGISNIDAPNTWKIYEAYYQQRMFEGRLSLLAGLYDLNSEFDVVERGGVFINSSFGIGPDYSQSGENGPSIFPTTSLALRLRFQPNEIVGLRIAAFDGVAGDPENPMGTKIIVEEDDGLLLAGEMDYLPPSIPGLRTALGAWFYTEASTTIVEAPSDGGAVDERRNCGGYILGETDVWTDDNTNRSVGLFGRYGLAESSINQIKDFIGFGIAANQLLTDDIDHEFGLGFAIARNSPKLVDMMQNEGIEVDRAETTIELTAVIRLDELITIQPDFQYIINPGTDKLLDNAVAVGLRLDVSL